jgi:HprK-related kinase A
LPSPTTYHFRIGIIGITLDSSIHRIAEEYRDLYKRSQIPDEQPNSLRISIRRSGKFPRIKPRYIINGIEKNKSFIVSEREVLPYIEWAINWHIAIHIKNFFQIHASLVEVDGQPILFPGAPGSGKTTIAAALAIKGARYFSDEFALIDPASLVAHPYPKALCLKEAAIPIISRLKKDLELESRWLKKQKGRVAFLDPWKLRDNPIASAAPIKHIVFPKHDGRSSPELVPMSKAEAVYELGKNSLNLLQYGGAGIRLLASIARSATCHRLRMGDLESSCQLLASLVKNEAISR